MEFYEILDQILALLQRHGRVTYGALKRQFNLDDAYLEDLKAEIIEARQLAVDQEGRVLVWTGAVGTTPESVPPHLPAVSQSLPQEDHSGHHVASPPAPRSAADAERRQLTVLFCDVVDSTVLASQLDPEDLRDVMRAYQETCAEVIRRFDGHIAQYLGDGLLVYFGYPQAHEDDARRAVYTGLEILAAMRRLNTRLERERRVQLAVRLGIHTEAGLNEPAVDYWQQAGQRAIERSANVEASSHLTRGLEVLATLPDTPERYRKEFVLQTTLGPVLMAIRGQGAPEVERAYARARELCQHVGETPQLFPVLWGLWYFYLARAEWRVARELGEQLLSLAQRTQDPPLLLLAHRVLGQTLAFLGEFASARSHLAQALTFYDPQQHRPLAFLYGQDQGVICHSWAALVLWLLGYPDQARQRSHEMLILAQELHHPHSLAYALYWAAMLDLYHRKGQAAQEQAEAGMVLSHEQGFALWIAWGTLLRGWALAEQGQSAEGILQMRQGIAAWQATGAEVFRPYSLALLAEAYGKAGQAEEGFPLLAEALAAVDNTGERYYEAELYRLKGEMLLAQADTEPRWLEVEESFRQALAVARHQQAKSLELRAAMSLSRLWQRLGKRAEAHQLLAEIYGWFTEGFDTADLQEARALLAELA